MLNLLYCVNRLFPVQPNAVYNGDHQVDTRNEYEVNAIASSNIHLTKVKSDADISLLPCTSCHINANYSELSLIICFVFVVLYMWFTHKCVTLYFKVFRNGDINCTENINMYLLTKYKLYMNTIVTLSMTRHTAHTDFKLRLLWRQCIDNGLYNATSTKYYALALRNRTVMRRIGICIKHHYPGMGILTQYFRKCQYHPRMPNLVPMAKYW